jgi:hypothetical protein
MNADAQSTTVTTAAAGTRKRFVAGGAGTAVRVMSVSVPGGTGEVWRLSAVVFVMVRWWPRNTMKHQRFFLHLDSVSL